MVGRKTSAGVELLGTCFLLDKAGLYATASHVTGSDDRNLVIVITPSTDINGYQDTSSNKVNMQHASIFKFDPVRDVCILKVEKGIPSNLRITTSDDINTTESCSIVGYPHCVQGRTILTYQTTVIGAKILIASSGIKSKHLVVNIQSRPGQSGSPIFQLPQYNVVAMLIGSYAPTNGGRAMVGDIDPQTLNQTTYAVSAEYISNMI